LSFARSEKKKCPFVCCADGRQSIDSSSESEDNIGNNDNS
jgi:hypothetical protein